MDHQTCFQFCGLGNGAGGGAAHAGLGLDDFHFDGLGQLDADGFAIEKFDGDLEIGDQVLDGIAEDVATELHLLIVFGVHEDVVVAVVVEVFHFFFVHNDAFDGVGGTEAVFENGSGTEVAQLGLDEGAQVAGGAVLDAEDGAQVVFVLDDHTGAHLSGWN